MKTAKIVRVPRWQIMLTATLATFLIHILDDIEKVANGRNPKAVLFSALFLYCSVFLIAGFAWAVVNYRFF